MPNTLLSHTTHLYSSLPPTKRSTVVSPAHLGTEWYADLKAKYLEAARDGDSEVPSDAADEVDFHYVCFVKSHGRLLQMDGDLKGIVDLGELGQDEDVISGGALPLIQRFMHDSSSDSLSFSMMALVPSDIGGTVSTP